MDNKFTTENMITAILMVNDDMSYAKAERTANNIKGMMKDTLQSGGKIVLPGIFSLSLEKTNTRRTTVLHGRAYTYSPIRKRLHIAKKILSHYK